MYGKAEGSARLLVGGPNKEKGWRYSLYSGGLQPVSIQESSPEWQMTLDDSHRLRMLHTTSVGDEAAYGLSAICLFHALSHKARRRILGTRFFHALHSDSIAAPRCFP